MRLVLDTSVLVAAIRSPSGASAEILRRVLRAELTMLASVPLYAEYEAVATRPDHLVRAGCDRRRGPEPPRCFGHAARTGRDPLPVAAAAQRCR